MKIFPGKVLRNPLARDVIGELVARSRSATTPFVRDDLVELREDAPNVVRRLFPDQEAEYARRGWKIFPRIDRVYVNARARAELGWTPRSDFRHVLDRLKTDEDPRGPLARAIGAKGYHAVTTGPYTVR